MNKEIKCNLFFFVSAMDLYFRHVLKTTKQNWNSSPIHYTSKCCFVRGKELDQMNANYLKFFPADYSKPQIHPLSSFDLHMFFWASLPSLYILFIFLFEEVTDSLLFWCVLTSMEPRNVYWIQWTDETHVWTARNIFKMAAAIESAIGWVLIWITECPESLQTI